MPRGDAGSLRSGSSSCRRPSAESLFAQPEALLDDALEPYRVAAEHALTLVRESEHNAESSQELTPILLRVPLALAA